MGPMVTALVVLLGYLIFFELIWHVVGPPLRRSASHYVQSVRVA